MEVQGKDDLAAIFDLEKTTITSWNQKKNMIRRRMMRIYSLMKPVTILLNRSGLSIKGT
jgi:hypothetical protein